MMQVSTKNRFCLCLCIVVLLSSCRHYGATTIAERCGTDTNLWLQGVFLGVPSSDARALIAKIEAQVHVKVDAVIEVSQDGTEESSTWSIGGYDYYAIVRKTRGPKLVVHFPDQSIKLDEFLACIGSPESVVTLVVSGPEGARQLKYLAYPKTGTLAMIAGGIPSRGQNLETEWITKLEIGLPASSSQELFVAINSEESAKRARFSKW